MSGHTCVYFLTDFLEFKTFSLLSSSDIISIEKHGLYNECTLFLTWKFLRQIGSAAARTHRHLTPPERDADVHRVCAGPHGHAERRPGAMHVRCFLVPDSGECGSGPDQPTEQRLGVGAVFAIHFQVLHGSVISCEMEALSSTEGITIKSFRGVSKLFHCARFHCMSHGDLQP